MSSSSASKRKHHEMRAPDWTILFEDVTSLRCLMDAASAVMQRVNCNVVKEKGGDKYMLAVDGADQTYSCCVSSRIRLDRVTFATDAPLEEFTFCVECKHVLCAIDNPSCAHGSLVMECHSEDATIHLRMQDPDQRSQEDSAVLSTFVDGNEPEGLEDMDFKMILEMDMTKLREIIKKASKVHAELLRIRIYLSDRGPKQRSLAVFSIDGDLYFCQKFCHETTVDADKSLVVRAVPQEGSDEDLFDVDGLEPEFEGRFPVEKINAFVKSLSCRMIAAKVMKGMPLLLNHSVNGANDESSYIRFLVAPINEDA